MTLELHGPSAAVHDHVSGRDGDFDETCAALEAAASLEVHTAVTRSNARSLAQLAQWICDPRRRHKIQRWVLRWPGPTPQGLSLPRLGLVAPRMLHAAALARSAGLTALTEGVPPCILGPHARHRASIEPRAYAQVCTRCAARPGCSGVPQRYLDAFEKDLELRPLTRITR